MSTKRFRRIYVTEPGFDMSRLTEFTDDVIFILSGLEDTSVVVEKCTRVLYEFNPDTDAYVPVGKVRLVLAVGLVLGKMFSERKSPIMIGLYKDSEYTFKEM